MHVPVVDRHQKPLMPTTPSRAARWVKSGKATPFWKRGVWCVRLNQDPSDDKTQDIAVGVDPGSKREGFTVKSEAHTYLNIQAHAVTWVKKHVEIRRHLRRARRYRNTPCRQPRWSNRRKGRLAPSTRARWNWKLRILNWLAKMYPIDTVCVEDIKATTRKGRGGKWNASFSPLQVGKKYFYGEVRDKWTLEIYQGYETKAIRDDLGLKKTKGKLAAKFSAHCVDSWALANDHVGGHISPDNEDMLLIKPIQFRRRQLHRQNFKPGGIRSAYGSTRSLGFERGSIVTHPKWGETYVGGTSKGRISLHCRKTGKRLCRNAKPVNITFRTYNSFTVGKVANSSTA